jgi:heterodisulfide reductase subunit C
VGSAFRKIKAKIVLWVLFFRSLLRRLFFSWKPEKGLEKFFENYSADAILTVSENERSQFPSYQKCQACSLCTFSCSALHEGRAPSSFEPKFIMLGYGRSSHESEYYLEEWLPCVECKACTVECPNDVPVHTMAQQIIERRHRVGFRGLPPQP